MALSNKQQAFVREYLVDFNGSAAAIRAGYSERSSRSTASELLTNPNIYNAIRENVMSAEEALVGITDIARGDIADLMDITPVGFTFRLMIERDGERIVNPKTKLIRKIKQKVTTVLAKSESGEDREIVETEIELYSAHEALRDIGKFHRVFADRVEHTGADGEAIKTETTVIYIPDNGRQA